MADRVHSGSKWYNVEVKVRFPDQKGYSFLQRQAYAQDQSTACRIAIKQVLASEAVEAIVKAECY
jgi:hypothetical protein